MRCAARRPTVERQDRTVGRRQMERAETRQVHTLLVYLDQDEVVLVKLQPDFISRDMTGQMRRLAYVDRRLQSFPHLRASDIPLDAVTLEIQPARADCRYVTVDDEALRDLRGLEMSRSAETALDGASANEAVKDMNAAIAAIPAFVAAEREKQRRAAPEAGHSQGRSDGFASWSSPASLALLGESHADLAARIRAAAQVLARYAVDPTVVEHAEAGSGAQALAAGAEDGATPSGIWRRFYDRPPAD